MARYEHLPIYKAALDLTVQFEVTQWTLLPQSRPHRARRFEQGPRSAPAPEVT